MGLIVFRHPGQSSVQSKATFVHTALLCRGGLRKSTGSLIVGPRGLVILGKEPLRGQKLVSSIIPYPLLFCYRALCIFEEADTSIIEVAEAASCPNQVFSAKALLRSAPVAAPPRRRVSSTGWKWPEDKRTTGIVLVVYQSTSCDH